MINNKIIMTIFLLMGLVSISACGRQSTPSMMNTSLPRVETETKIDQIAVDSVNQNFLYSVASNYDRFATDTLMMTISYDPSAKDYDGMKAFQDLARFKDSLGKMGVRSIRAEAVKTTGIKPTLMIAYDMVTAKAPAGCRNMPGFDDGLTTAESTDYRFGCSIDTMVANQIYRPSDLQGYVGSDVIDGRRAANTVEYYRRVDQEEAEGEIERFERNDIQGE